MNHKHQFAYISNTTGMLTVITYVHFKNVTNRPATFSHCEMIEVLFKFIYFLSARKSYQKNI